MYCHNII